MEEENKNRKIAEEVWKFLSSSSSETTSSSSSETEEFLEFLELVFTRDKKHRVKNFVNDVVSKYSEIEFRKNFRISRKTAELLIQKYQNSTYFTASKRGRNKTSAKVQCLAFLWFAGNKKTYREVANFFGMPISTARTHLGNFIEFLYDISKEFIQFPKTEEEKKEKAEGFARIGGIPDTIGCIDGCYIYVRKPAHKISSTYVNRDGLICIKMQGICDANKKFTDVFLCSPSKVHDSRIFQLSFISKDIPTICGEKYHLLGEAAYPIREYLITPFKDNGDLPEQHRKFNKEHCQIQVKIDDSFGLLKQRFRQLIRLDFFSVERMCKFVIGCCVLHNLCIDEMDVWDVVEDDASEELSLPTFSAAGASNSETVSEALLKHLGTLKRYRISETI